MLISAAGREYRRAVGHEVLQGRAVGICRPSAYTGRLAVTVNIHAPDRRRRDIDNVAKALLDALTHAGLWEDDSQLDDLRLIRGAVRPRNGCVVVAVAQIDGMQEAA